MYVVFNTIVSISVNYTILLLASGLKSYATVHFKIEFNSMELLEIQFALNTHFKFIDSLSLFMYICIY